MEAGFRISVIGENIPGVIQDDVEYDMEADGVSSVDQRTQFIVCLEGICCESRLSTKEIVDSVPVIAAVVKTQVLQNRTEPNGACSKILYVVELVLNSGEFSSLEIKIAGVIEGLVKWSTILIIEAIHHQKVDGFVPPIFW